ncbi:MAG: DUF4469 domain-containing protein [Spirochaetaceae bacterium]|nr:DUF4469 domain-containing protein [Spirochaetaceae bacterium]
MIDKKNELTNSVNVTMHESSLTAKKFVYARVQRETAYIGNILDDVLTFNKNLDRPTLLFAVELIKTSIKNLLKAGKAVDILELGVMYLKPSGIVEGGDVNNVPKMTLGFTPSEEALEMVKDVAVAADVTKSNSPVISSLFDMHSETVTDSLSAGYTVRIRGDKLKIAGSEAGDGLFFAPCDESGKKSDDETEWTHIRPAKFIDNTAKTLVFNVPQDMKAGKYRLIVRTAYGSGSRINKSRREGEYENIVVVA